jgi:hypothetical protein
MKFLQVKVLQMMMTSHVIGHDESHCVKSLAMVGFMILP